MVYELLKIGKENAITSSELRELIGVSKRNFYSIVRKERNNGAVIIADGNGYYIPGNRDEVKAYLHRTQLRAIHDMSAAKTARMLLQANKRAGFFISDQRHERSLPREDHR